MFLARKLLLGSETAKFEIIGTWINNTPSPNPTFPDYDFTSIPLKAGDLLILLYSSPREDFVAPSGFSILLNFQNADTHVAIATKIADGTEGVIPHGTQPRTGKQHQAGVIVMRLASPGVAAHRDGTFTSPSLDVTPGSTLFAIYAEAGGDGEQFDIVGTPPPGYEVIDAGMSRNACLILAVKYNANPTENPGSWTNIIPVTNDESATLFSIDEVFA